MASAPVPGIHSATLDALRRRFAESGELPQHGLAAPILRSWQRCQRLGLEMAEAARPAQHTRGDLMVARERNAALLAQASAVMEDLYAQIRASGSMVLLADASGMILHGIGDSAFVDRASRIALQPGASWSESERGTNAIGATLIERAAVEILGAEHYLDCNGVLTCSAAPIFDWRGELLGALDISGDQRRQQPHTLGLARLGVRMVERQLFECEHARHALLAFHPRAESVGSLQEGLLAIDADGCIVAADRQARSLLGVDDSRAARLGAFNKLFRSTFGTVLGRAAREAGARMALELRSGARIHACVRISPAWRPIFTPSAPTTSTADTATSATAHPRSPQGVAAAAALTLQTLATGDAALQVVLDRCARIVGRNIPILIQGESGSGKELLARACHFSGPRANGPFVAVNCAAIPENLIESELFGYAGGAFTGARKEGAIGRIQQAHGGTLFLDEIGDMPLAMQARLLRVLQERCVQPVGAAAAVAVDIALLCATHRALEERIDAGLFREDLYYRVNGFAVRLPPLRERSDLDVLVRRILDASRNHPAPASVRVAPRAMALLRACRWPGNIRQLHNVLEVALALLDDGEDEIDLHHLPDELPRTSATQAQSSAATRTPLALPATGARAVDDNAIRTALARHNGNLSAAARELGVARNTLYRRMGRRF